MLRRLLGLQDRSNLAVVDALYGNIVAAARRPVFYAGWDVPDTPLGRYEMMALHMFLLLHRLRGETGAAREIAQELTDEFFKDVEHSLRELGIGDSGVPKRMKRLGRMFYGRVAAYDAALQQGDRDAMAAALARNVMPEAPAWPHAGALAAYAFDVRDALASQSAVDLASARVTFPEPAQETLA